MSFTYTLSTDIGKVRLNIGDTVSGTAKLTDEEIQIALTDHVGVLPASVRCVEWIIAGLAKTPDRSVVGINSTSPIDQYNTLLESLRSRSLTSGAALTAYHGTTSQDRIDEAEDDDDFVKPTFTVGMDDIDGPADPSVE